MQSGKGARDTAEVKKIRRTVRMFSNLKTLGKWTNSLGN